MGQIPTGPRVAQPGADAVRWIAPSGAVSVEAVEATGLRKPAAVGGGTYAVILEDGEHGEPALGYRDAAGSFIHRPMPAEYAHQPVPDADSLAPCAARSSTTSTSRPRSGAPVGAEKVLTRIAPSPLVVCRVCGHQEQEGAITRYGQPDNSDEDPAEGEARMARIRAEQAVQRWYSTKMTLMAVTFPIYAAQDWPARIHGTAHAVTIPRT